MKKILLPSIQMTLGAVISILIANIFELKYSTTAGIISILSIQLTKKEAINIALKRVIASLLAIFSSYILFYLIGFNIYVFGLYLILFIPLAYILKIHHGIVVSSVLVTHILIEKTSNIILNEIYILLIGVSIALMLNLSIPQLDKKIKDRVTQIDIAIKNLLEMLSDHILNKTLHPNINLLFNNLNDLIDKNYSKASFDYNNYLFKNEKFYINYISMRQNQFNQLLRIKSSAEKLTKSYLATKEISDYLKNLSCEISFCDKASKNLALLNNLKNKFKTFDLPKDREEFENRAILFQILSDIELFLEYKIIFHQKNESQNCTL